MRKKDYEKRSRMISPAFLSRYPSGSDRTDVSVRLQRIWQYVSQVIQSATSGISSTKASHHQAGAPSSSNHSVYTLNGRRLLSNAQNLSHLQRGVYIVNGQKTIIQ